MNAAVKILALRQPRGYVALAFATIDQWRRQRDCAAAWAALGYGTLGLVVVIGQVVPEHPDGSTENFLQRVDIALLLLFPYLLHRFTTVFRAATSSSSSRIAARGFRNGSCRSCSNASHAEVENEWAAPASGGRSRSYARAHDGDLVYEEAEPHGARFQLVLPARTNGNGEDVEAPPEVEAHRLGLFGRR